MTGTDAEGHKDVLLTKEQITGLLEMYENYQRSRWLGRIVWKVSVAVGAAIAGIAAAKDHIVHIFTRGG